MTLKEIMKKVEAGNEALKLCRDTYNKTEFVLELNIDMYWYKFKTYKELNKKLKDEWIPEAYEELIKANYEINNTITIRNMKVNVYVEEV